MATVIHLARDLPAGLAEGENVQGSGFAGPTGSQNCQALPRVGASAGGEQHLKAREMCTRKPLQGQTESSLACLPHDFAGRQYRKCLTAEDFTQLDILGYTKEAESFQAVL